MQIIFCHQAWRLLRRLLIGLLMICGMFPSLARAEIWHSTPTSGMRDVAIAPNGLIWLTGGDGTVWASDNIYGSSFTQIGASGFSRVSVGPDNTVWAIGSNGALWKFVTDSWVETTANGMEDVAIAPDGKVWLVGKNGTIWFSDDQERSSRRLRQMILVEFLSDQEALYGRLSLMVRCGSLPWAAGLKQQQAGSEMLLSPPKV
ncbi:MAG: hypothetical protein IPP22_14570 [Nitrosomonas sp.]|nr:hypothetical protein [Nitrosomonas sp.]